MNFTKTLENNTFFSLTHLNSKNEMLFIFMLPPQHQSVCGYGDISSETMPWYKKSDHIITINHKNKQNNFRFMFFFPK